VGQLPEFGSLGGYQREATRGSRGGDKGSTGVGKPVANFLATGSYVPRIAGTVEDQSFDAWHCGGDVVCPQQTPGCVDGRKDGDTSWLDIASVLKLPEEHAQIPNILGFRCVRKNHGIEVLGGDPVQVSPGMRRLGMIDSDDGALLGFVRLFTGISRPGAPSDVVNSLVCQIDHDGITGGSESFIEVRGSGENKNSIGHLCL
jgi:hypothetical protein